MELTTTSFPEVKDISNVSKDNTTFLTTRKGLLPGIASLLDVLRNSTDNSPQSSNDQTTSNTWKKFRIWDEKSNKVHPLSSIFCPLDHDDPVFSLDWIPHSRRQFCEGLLWYQMKPLQKTKDGIVDGRQTCDKVLKYQEHHRQKRKHNEVSKEIFGSEGNKEMNGRFNSPMKTANTFEFKMWKNNPERLKVEQNFFNSPMCTPYSPGNPNSFNTVQSVQIEGNCKNISLTLPSSNHKSSCSTQSLTLNTCGILKPRNPEERSIRDLFTSLEKLISCEADETKDQSVTRAGILESSARFIKSLLKKTQRMKREIKCKSIARKKCLNIRKRQEPVRSTKSITSKIDRKPSKKVVCHTRSTNKAKRSNSKTNDAPKIRQTIVSESETEADFQLKDDHEQNVAITFVSENQSSQVSDASKKSIALFFADNKKKISECPDSAKETTKGQKEGCKVTTDLRKLKLKKREIERLEKKAFLTFAKHWRPRLKKEMPVCNRKEITNMLKCRWEGLSKKTKRRYRKIWEEETQVKSTALIVKPKTAGCQEIFTRSKNEEERDSRKPTVGKPKKKQGKMKNANKGKNDGPLKQGQNESKNEDENLLLSVINWAQCDRCKKWRILSANENVNLLPKRWFCRMNKDKNHNSCSVPQESYTLKA